MNRLAAFALAIVLCPSLAAAKELVGDPPTRFGEVPRKSYESSQWFAFELKFSPYSPMIDSSSGLNGHTPFADLFTSQTDHHRPDARLLTQVEFDVQFLHKHGSLGVGVTAGYARRTSHSFQFDDLSGKVSCTVPNCIRSGDQTALNVMPFSLLAVYRWDWLALRYHVPLVPYFKIGLAYYIWWIENGSGATASFTNAAGKKEDGYGGTWGWVLNPGLSFLLDVIDPSAARTIDAELGINHTYVFVELHYADVSGFGQPNRLTLSDTTFNTGLAFEF
jgi:hypothetical protein